MRTEGVTVHRRALLRAVPESLAVYGSDIAGARAQHAAYAAALRDAGVETTILPADERLPDCCFLEDCVVVDGERALIARMGRPDRRAEAVAVMEALAARGFELTVMEGPATLDGGDVLRVGDRVFVGLSTRTNEAGCSALEEFLGRPAVAVAVRGCLHLKTACTQVGPATVALRSDWIDPDPFEGLEIVSASEPNALLVNGHCLVADQDLGRDLARRGLDDGARVLDISEFRKADAGLTCLAVLLA